MSGLRMAQTGASCCPSCSGRDNASVLRASTQAAASRRGATSTVVFWRQAGRRGSLRLSAVREAVEAPAATAAQAVPHGAPLPLGWGQFCALRYPVGSVLGSGGYGTVFLSEDSLTGQAVAVKRIPKSRKRSSPIKVQRNLRREASLLEDLQFCPSVVQLVDKFEDERDAYLVMEHLPGGSLEEYLRKHRRSMTEGDMAAVACSVLSFLAHCHAERVCFGDVKPANFMLTSSGSKLGPRPILATDMKVVDFGCSQRLPKGAYLTSRVGTFKFFAPEVFGQAYGFEADSWSAGIMLYRIMTGKYPWWALSEQLTPTDAMHDICSDELVPFEDEEWAMYSTEARSFVEALLQKDPAQRMSAVQALEHPWLQQQPAPPSTLPWPFNNVISLNRKVLSSSRPSGLEDSVAAL